MSFAQVFLVVGVASAIRNNELDAFTSALDGLEKRFTHTGVIEDQRLTLTSVPSIRFAETSVQISSVPPAQPIASAPATARTDNEWHHVAETAVQHEQDTQKELMGTIKGLRAQLAEAQAHALDLDGELIEKEKEQQERFVEEVRKEERMRATQQQFMAKKLTAASNKMKQDEDNVRAEARANVTTAEHALALETQRLRNATNLVGELQGWEKAAKRSFVLGQGKAVVMEDLSKEKKVSFASAKVAEQWRTASLKALESAITNSGVEIDTAATQLLLRDAGNTPEKLEAAIETMKKDQTERKAKAAAQAAAEAKNKLALASGYPFASWELSSIGGRAGPDVLHTLPDDPLSFLHQPLPSTHLMDTFLESHHRPAPRRAATPTHASADPLAFLHNPLPATGIMDRMMAAKYP